MRSWIWSAALAVAFLGMIGIQSASAALQIRRISPDPMLIGSPVTIEGTDFGEPGSRRLYWGAYGALGGAPSGDLGAMHIRSWSDTRIVLNIPIYEEGRYWLRILNESARGDHAPGTLVEVGTDEDGVSFDAILPTPTISRYGTPAVCPGASFSIHGNNFGNRTGMFTILWDKIGEDREYGVTIREDAISRWTNSEIRFRLPSDLPVYISPGVRYRITLGKRGERSGLTIVARGPDGRLADNCNRPEARTPGTPLQIGPLHPITFKLAPLKTPASTGDQIFFGGTFTAPPELQSQLRSSPLTVEWKILRQGESRAVTSNRVQLRGRTTPFLVKTRADRAGTYLLELRLVSPPSGVLFRPDLSAAKIQVNAKLLNERIDPSTAKQPPKGLPPGTKAPKLQFPGSP